MCHDLAQGWNRMEITLNLGLMGHSARVIKPLDEATAVKTGAEVLGEGIVFGIAAFVLIVENRRAAASEARKAMNIKTQFEAQQRRIEQLEEAVASLRADTIDLMKHGGSISAEEMQQRIREEKRRRELVQMNSQLVLDEGLWGYLTSLGRQAYETTI
eukprot:CAMPEP_0172190254 /NCGR_PEP_ID=MMETSP1050-20130122/23009_1 /TAXON_ID=233186 /ORGANISM="Cryptomonas curvata, Strain CCAP979/52" /LENGTH=157 /DNA_ID=CAMNT_0012865103 /DNA_START=101 /DNA_END=571 /DNA_ORIENTATION=+